MTDNERNKDFKKKPFWWVEILPEPSLKITMLQVKHSFTSRRSLLSKSNLQKIYFIKTQIKIIIYTDCNLEK